MVRRCSPFAPPAIVAAFLIGAATGGWDAGWSAAIGVAIVFANFTAHALSLARAARVSLTALYAVALGGFVVRLAVITAILVLLTKLEWFSVVAFVIALVPSTVVLLAAEMKLLSGRMQMDLWTLPTGPNQARS